MKHFALATAVFAAGLLSVPAAFAQQTSANTPSQKDEAGTATKQKTQTDPTSQYNFPTPGGQYSSRPAVKQRSDGQAVTGSNNMAGGSK
jgi:hypothetical protein